MAKPDIYVSYGTVAEFKQEHSRRIAGVFDSKHHRDIMDIINSMNGLAVAHPNYTVERADARFIAWVIGTETGIAGLFNIYRRMLNDVGVELLTGLDFKITLEIQKLKPTMGLEEGEEEIPCWCIAFKANPGNLDEIMNSVKEVFRLAAGRHDTNRLCQWIDLLSSLPDSEAVETFFDRLPKLLATTLRS